ncbi:UPF0182 family protein [Phosphitispora sp. TUW77]|uniref:UPF0182 family membrane protein n=1 Tax=Phosphitispora sp. TUW77 TaxID=3152361 RepID=UPI003AB50ADA
MKKTSISSILLIVILFAALLVKIFSNFYVKLAWFNDLGYSQLFITPLLAKLKIGATSFIIYFLILFIMGIIAFRVFTNAQREEIKPKNKLHLYVFDNLSSPKEKDITPPNYRKTVSVIFLISMIISLVLALGTTGQGWIKLLQFINAAGFGVQEQVFGKDASFYVFKLPFYNFILESLLSSLTIIFIFSLVFFPLTGLLKLRGNIFRKGAVHIPGSIRKFWAVFAGILFILFGLKKYLSMYAVIYSQTGYVFGAGYTDIHVSIPLAKILALLAIFCGLASFLYFFINDHRLLLGGIALYLVVAVLGSVVHGLIQYNVSNNEFTKEKPYIQEEMKFTKLAYNLNKITVKDYPGDANLTLQNINNNRETMDNIRLNDPKPLKTVLSQNQGLRYYYKFNDIDVDRYNIDGKYKQVMLSAREMSENALTEKAGTFVNMTMRYTHGYGAAATLANEIDPSGYAHLIVKDIPPSSKVEGIEIKEPRIYFGELTNDTSYGYVIGNTAAKEFDYPQGDDNMENTYQGKTGLKFTELNKLFLSAYFDTFRFYLADEINEDSKLLMIRNIRDRVTTLMPYLEYDSDPYVIAANDGKLYWILDAYTYTNRFPYAAPVGNLNYIRNSVKVVIDPYNGTVDFFVTDKNDPVLKTLAGIFPGVFKDLDLMPANLKEHIRYPEDYFNIQSYILLNFHVNNPSVFYNREDTWEIAKKVGENGTNNIEPYYSIMKLPNEEKAEFTLMLPFTPASRSEQHRNNLVAWLAARNDGEHYGELCLYKVPKNVEVQGPLMIDSLIDQDTNISSKLTLWSQGGSDVIRGNLLAVPIDDGFIYVEPIYIKAAQQGASIPQMQAIVFAIDKKIIMVETKDLDTAVAKFFAQEGMQGIPPEDAVDTGKPEDSGGLEETRQVTPKESILQQIEQLKKQLESLEQNVKSL